MDLHAVPFPTTHHPEDSSFVDKRPAVPSRLHSTPSLPNLLVPPHHYPRLPSLPLQGSARHRPHLCPLDLASSSPPSPPHRDSADFSRRISSLLTPPLTPSSSFNSASQDTPSTPPDLRSPLRWVSSSDRERAFAAVHAAYTAGLKTHMSSVPSTTTMQNGGFLTPTSVRSQSISSDDGAGVATSASPDVTALSAALNGLEVTPWDERPYVLAASDAQNPDLDIGETSSEKSTRLLLVRNVPSNVPSRVLLDILRGMGDAKAMQARLQATHGIVILAFYDIRDSVRAMKHISGNRFPTLGDARLAAAYVSPAQVEKLMGKSDFLAELDGSFFVTVEGRTVVPHDVQNLLSSFGELASFSGAGSDPHDQTFHVDYYDCRCAANAYKQLNNRSMFGARLSLFSNKDALDHPVRLMQAGSKSSDESEFQRAVDGRLRPRSVSTSEGMGTADTVRIHKKVKEVSQDHGRRSSNDLFFDAVGKVFGTSHATVPSPRNGNTTDDHLGLKVQPHVPNGYVVAVPSYPYSGAPYPGYGAFGAAQVPPMYPPHSYPYPVYAHEVGMYGCREGEVVNNSYWTYAAPHPPHVEYYIPSAPRTPVYVPPVTPMLTSPGRQSPWDGSEAAWADYPRVGTSNGNSAPATDSSLDTTSTGQRVSGGKNAVDITAIENGADTRTTVMIKNIPNKMNDTDLKSFIDRVCPRRIDFMYLRMDFQNGCNVGYAFVNFITVQDLLHFAKTQIGVKWNMYSSEKTLQMCYATYQGKESLVEKFKNSSIMDEKEAWRPKIYYSDGPHQGMPEPFPPPTHLRRKERSQHNRGALFVPGTLHQPSGGGGGGLFHRRPNPPRLRLR